jgi:hypothetical protein
MKRLVALGGVIVLRRWFSTVLNNEHALTKERSQLYLKAGQVLKML